MKPTKCSCPTREILDRVGDKWSVLTIITLADTPKNKYRFSELQRKVEGISQRMLTTNIAPFRTGWVCKTVFLSRNSSSNRI